MPSSHRRTRMKFYLLALCLVVASPAHAVPILEMPGLTSIVFFIPLVGGAFEGRVVPVADLIANPTALHTLTWLPGRNVTFRVGISDADGNSVGASGEYLLFESTSGYSISSIFLHAAATGIATYPTHTVIGPADLANAFGPTGGDLGHLGVPQSVVGFGAVPEPATGFLLVGGLTALALRRRRAR